MNMNEVYQLMDKFEASTLAELTLEMEGVKLSVKKGCAGAQSPSVFAATPGVATPSMTPGKTITAPLVGTFYRAPRPGEKPFVEVGQQVKKGDVVGIIEAMKLMNEITAEQDGVILEICVTNGQVVEYGTELFRVKR